MSTYTSLVFKGSETLSLFVANAIKHVTPELPVALSQSSVHVAQQFSGEIVSHHNCYLAANRFPSSRYYIS